jgi:transposase
MSGRPVAHVAKEMGVSRTCAHRWISRFRSHGSDGLQDRSSRQKSSLHATPVEVVADVLTQRVEHREGPTELALRCGTSARTVSRILARAGMPRLWDLDPVSGHGSGLPAPPTGAMNATPQGT